MSALDEIQNIIDAGRFDEAMEALDNLLKESPSDTAFFLRGKLNWRLGHHGAATTDFEHAIAVNPDSPARHALEMARDITDYFNPDLLNP